MSSSPPSSSEDEQVPEQIEETKQTTNAKPKSILKATKKDRKEQKEKRKFDFERNERTVFVGNLPSTMDHRDVEKLFKACGPVESARIRSIVPEKEKLPPKVAHITQRIHPKVDSVNAYVVFAKTDNDDCIKKALAMNGKVVDNHHLRVDRAQHPNSKRMTLTSRKKSVFVGNLRFDLRDDDLISHFAKAGEVDYVRLVRDRATGLGKGFGFVKFTERAAVKKALEMNDSDFKGRPLRVKKVDDKMPMDDDKESKKPNKGKMDKSAHIKKVQEKVNSFNDRRPNKMASNNDRRPNNMASNKDRRPNKMASSNDRRPSRMNSNNDRRPARTNNNKGPTKMNKANQGRPAHAKKGIKR